MLLVAAMMAVMLSIGPALANSGKSDGPWCHKGKVKFGKGHGKHGDKKAKYSNKKGKYVCYGHR